MSQSKGSILGATLLVGGTCIGGGMLALPVATGVAGFFPSLAMMLIGWAFMTLTALYLAEASLWMEEGAHVITIASRLLGPIGKVIAWSLYLFIGYASLVAYTAGGGELFSSLINQLFHLAIPESLASVLFVLVFGGVLYLGNVVLGRVNTLLMIGLILAYILLICMGTPYVRLENLKHTSWGSTLLAVPLLLTIFSFQTIVPSLTLYLKQDGRALRLSIVLGTTLALVIYVIWQWLVLGAVLVDGDHGLAAALAMGKPATEFLGIASGNTWLGSIADFFAFFALITSFLGIALGLFDFLADGLRIQRDGVGSLALGILVAVPTLIFALSLEKVFLTALDTSGGIGDSILNGLFPALMVWVGRYHRKFDLNGPKLGGKPVLVFAMLYAIFVLAIELLGKFGVIASLTGG